MLKYGLDLHVWLVRGLYKTIQAMICCWLASVVVTFDSISITYAPVDLIGLTGDGVGIGGRTNIDYLREMGSISVQEALVKCPGLLIRPMRTDRYRQVAAQIHELLHRWSTKVLKSGYEFLHRPQANSTFVGEGGES